jgi:hypothetical protein
VAESSTGRRKWVLTLIAVGLVWLGRLNTGRQTLQRLDLTQWFMFNTLFEQETSRMYYVHMPPYYHESTLVRPARIDNLAPRANTVDGIHKTD